MNIKLTEYTLFAELEKKVRFAFLADLHNYPNEPILKALQNLNADAVLVSGDFIHNLFICQRGFEFLKEASKILPVFCSLGNHESGYMGKLREKILKSGAVLLDNSFCEFKGIHIGGLTSGAFYPGENCHPNTNFLTEFSQLNGYKLLLCHHPEYYKKYVKDLPIDLTLSGHAHGGQWRLFGRGAYAPGQGAFPKYTKGMYDNRLIVTSGLGNVYFVPKINNPPEICTIMIVVCRNA